MFCVDTGFEVDISMNQVCPNEIPLLIQEQFQAQAVCCSLADAIQVSN